MNSFDIINGAMVESDVCVARLAFERGHARSELRDGPGFRVSTQDFETFHVIDNDGWIVETSTEFREATAERDRRNAS